MATRECPYCGEKADARLTSCPSCREALPETPRQRQTDVQELADAAERASRGNRWIRHGLLYMLLAAVMGYFVSGASPLAIPVFVSRPVMDYFVLLLFLSGLALSLYGFFQRHVLSH